MRVIWATHYYIDPKLWKMKFRSIDMNAGISMHDRWWYRYVNILDNFLTYFVKPTIDLPVTCFDGNRQTPIKNNSEPTMNTTIIWTA